MNTTLNIINLPNRKDRLDACKDELKAQCVVDAEFWPGVVGWHTVQQNISRAHKRIVRFAKHRGLPNVIIGEDDLKFTAPGAWQYFLDSIPAQYDLFLASIYTGTIKEDGTVSDFSGMTLYSVHERFYDTFLALDETKHIDRALSGKGVFYVCDKFCAIQRNGYSDNRKKHCNYDSYLEGRLIFGAAQPS